MQRGPPPSWPPPAQVRKVGRDRLVLDLSCRKKEDGQYYVVTDRWQRFSDLAVKWVWVVVVVGVCVCDAPARRVILCPAHGTGCLCLLLPRHPPPTTTTHANKPLRSEATLEELAGSCSEFLVHGVDVEGMQLGIDEELVGLLAGGSPIDATYAGGARTLVRAGGMDWVSGVRVWKGGEVGCACVGKKGSFLSDVTCQCSNHPPFHTPPSRRTWTASRARGGAGCTLRWAAR